MINELTNARQFQVLFSDYQQQFLYINYMTR